MVLLLRTLRPPSSAPETPDFPRVSTWHLSGTCLIEGKSLPWEIWGQANPPFQYERRGAAIRTSTVSEGELLLPPLPQAPPVIIRSLPASGRNHLVTLAPWAQQEKDPKTDLPTRYVVKDRQTGQLIGELSACYNAPLPEGVREPLNARNTPVQRLLPQPRNEAPLSPVFAYGMKIQGRVLAQDKEGNVQLAVEAQPGTRPPLALRATVTVAEYSLPVGSLTGVRPEQRSPPYDDQKEVYLPVTLGGTDGIWLRRVPLSRKKPRPKTITLSVLVQPELRPDAARLLPDARLNSGRVWLTLPLPPTMTPQLLAPPATLAQKRQIYKSVLLSTAPTPRRTGTTVY